MYTTIAECDSSVATSKSFRRSVQQIDGWLVRLGSIVCLVDLVATEFVYVARLQKGALKLTLHCCQGFKIQSVSAETVDMDIIEHGTPGDNQTIISYCMC